MKKLVAKNAMLLLLAPSIVSVEPQISNEELNLLTPDSFADFLTMIYHTVSSD